jgi:hypothetical protein
MFFIWLLQVFDVDVTKLDEDVEYVAMVVHVCCKLLFLIFQFIYKRMLHVCLSEMLYVFHTYVACVLSECCIYIVMTFHAFLGVFTSVSDVRWKCFIWMLSRTGTASPFLPSVVSPRCLLFSMLAMFGWCGLCGDERRRWDESFERRKIRTGGTRGRTRGLAGAVAPSSTVDSFKYLYKYLYL